MGSDGSKSPEGNKTPDGSRSPDGTRSPDGSDSPEPRSESRPGSKKGEAKCSDKVEILNREAMVATPAPSKGWTVSGKEENKSKKPNKPTRVHSADDLIIEDLKIDAIEDL